MGDLEIIQCLKASSATYVAVFVSWWCRYEFS